MEITTVSLIIAIVALLIALITFYQFHSAEKPSEEITDFNSIPLKLQAYERLVMLCERIAIPQLISRTNQPQLSAKEMQFILLENIKQEFEYNTSQQIYVSPAAWDAVRSLKDQNMLIINEVATMLAPEATAIDLNRQLLEVIMNQKDKALHLIVLDALNFEAKKLLR